uniref:Uncharacterized protein n=1 Tax=Arundo donax TaxID=35708 RepID=A0A0A9CQN5_ARUDO
MVLFDGHRVLVLLHSNGVLHDSHRVLVLLCCDRVLTGSRGSSWNIGGGGEARPCHLAGDALLGSGEEGCWRGGRAAMDLGDRVALGCSVRRRARQRGSATAASVDGDGGFR